ncbi:MAG: DUF1858 domain-containing protein [Chloroflexota bacterium]|nr:DUF1858 domain-containing protein [Chloroflexota bacterium]
MKRKEITLKLIVADILDRWPQVIPVFLEYKMKCVGCSMAAFEILADALRIHGIPADQFLAEVNVAVAEGETHRSQMAGR